MNSQMKIIRSENLDKLFSNRAKYRKLGFALFAFLILAAGIAFFVLSIGKPYMGMTLSLGTQGWSVDSIDRNGIAYQAGIRVGDIPIEINYQPAQTFLEKYTEAGAVYGPLIEELVTVDSLGQNNSAILKGSSVPLSSAVELITWFITSIIFWVVGFFVFSKRPQNYAAILLCLCGLFFGLTLGSNMATERAIPTAILFSVFSLTISPFLLLHFFLVLPEERRQLRKSLLINLIYLPPVITLVLFPFIGYDNGQLMPWFRNVRLIEFIIAMLAAVAIALINYLRATSPKTRQQMKIMALSTAVALIPFLVLSFLFPTTWKQTSVPYGFQMLFVSLIPVGMGYAVVTQRLFDIDLVIRRSVIYGLITIVIALILSIGIFLAINFRELIGVPEEIIIAIILGGTATVLFGPLKKGIEYFVDRLLYKDRYDYRRIIQTLSDSLNSLNDLDDISRLIVNLTANTLNLAGACLFVNSQSGLELRAVQGTFDYPDKQSWLVNLINKRSNIIEFPNSLVDIDSDVAFLIPLITGEKEVGFLCISPKLSRQAFSNDDIYLLQGISSVAAWALRSAMLIRDVSLRNTFVSIASHELRTPLTSIIGFSDLLVRRDPPEKTRKTWAKNVFNNAERLSALVDELLNVARIQSGKMKLTVEATRLVEVLEKQLEMARQSTDKHKFIINIEEDLPEALVDSDKFGHIIINLLSNAIKYSPKGGQITISAHFDRERNRIIMAIADEGIGISSRDKESLFTTFHRIQRPETMGIGGSGLGLYITKEWTEAMGGKIWVESELNKGSTFFIGIPAKNSEKSNLTLRSE